MSTKSKLVDLNGLNIVKQGIEKIVDDNIVTKIYNNTQEMLADTNLKVGDKVKTFGYHTWNDGGGAFYNIVQNQAQSLVEEMQLNNGLYARLIIENPLNIKQMGAEINISCSDIINKAVLLSHNVLIPAGKYILDKPLDIPSKVHLYGESTRTSILSVSTRFPSTNINTDFSNYAIRINDNQSNFNLEDFSLEGNEDVNCGGIYIKNCYNYCSLKNLSIYDFNYQSIYVDYINDFSQSLLIDNCIIYNRQKNYPIMYANRCFEMNIVNSKFLHRASSDEDISTKPNILLVGMRDLNVQGCSFLNTSCGAIKAINGCRQSGFISNTFENVGSVDGCFIDFGSDDETTSNEIQYINNVVIARNYYNSVKAVKFHSKYYTSPNTLINCYAIGGGSENISIYGTPNEITGAGGYLTTLNGYLANNNERLYLTKNNTNTNRYYVKDDSSASADNGLTLIINKNGTDTNLARITPTKLEFLQPTTKLVLRDSNNKAHIMQVDTNNVLTGIDIPKATTTSVGGVKVGSGLSVNENGLLTANLSEIPIANATTLGGVKVGDGLNISEGGTLSVDSSSLYPTYSNDETIIGEYLGKPLYAKVITIGTMPNSATTTHIAHNIENIDKVINVYGRMYLSGALYPLPWTSASSTTSNIAVYASQTEILITTGKDNSRFGDATITLEYTKNS